MEKTVGEPGRDKSECLRRKGKVKAAKALELSETSFLERLPVVFHGKTVVASQPRSGEVLIAKAVQGDGNSPASPVRVDKGVATEGA